MNRPASHLKSDQVYCPHPPAWLKSEPVGIGLRSPHYQDIIDTKPKLGWMEIHPENYFCGGAHRHILDQIAEHYPLSMHAVGLSLGSDQAVDISHLKQFKALIDQYNPFMISDHASWSASGNAHLNDLLPLPYTRETLDRLCQNIDQTQNYFGRRILVENPSSYIAFENNDMPEYEFMNRVAEKSGCGILLDVNNIYVQSHNHSFDPIHYIDNINPDIVGEIHLAGHIEKTLGDHTLLIDTHNKQIRQEVWALYDHAITRFGVIPTLIEWDQDFPPLQTLLDEANSARKTIERIEQQRQICP